MAELRVNQFFLGTVPGTTLQNLYTVPVGHRAILKRLTMRSRAGATQTVYLYLNNAYALRSWSIAAPGAGVGEVDFGTWLIVSAGQPIGLRCTNAAGVDAMLGGTLHYI